MSSCKNTGSALGQKISHLCWSDGKENSYLSYSLCLIVHRSELCKAYGKVTVCNPEDIVILKSSYNLDLIKWTHSQIVILTTGKQQCIIQKSWVIIKVTTCNFAKNSLLILAYACRHFFDTLNFMNQKLLVIFIYLIAIRINRPRKCLQI